MSRKIQRKYNSVFDIDVDILKHKRTANKLEAQATDITREFKRCTTNSNNDELTDGERKYWSEQADWENKKFRAIRKKIASIFEMQIPRLVRTRAAMQTIPMSFMDPKEGVVLQHEK